MSAVVRTEEWPRRAETVARSPLFASGAMPRKSSLYEAATLGSRNVGVADSPK